MNGHRSHSALAAVAIMGGLYLLMALISLALSRAPGSMASLWYPNAVAIAFAVMRPWRQMPLTLLTAGACVILANMLWGDSWTLALRFVPPNLLEIALASTLLKRAGLDQRSIEEPVALIKVLVLGCVLAPLAGAWLGALVLPASMDTSPTAIARSWFASTVIGGASVLPLGLLLQRTGWPGLRQLGTDPMFWGALTSSAGVTLLVHAYLPYPFVFTIIPLMVAAMTLPMLGTALVTLAVSLSLGLMMAIGILVPPPTAWAWQQLFVYLALAAALVPAQVLAASRSTINRAQEHLAHSAASLQQANTGLQQFIHMASHDMREPVNTVSQFAGLLRDDHLTQLPPQAQDYLRRINHGALRMRTLLDDVLQYVILSQRDAIDLAPVDLDQCLQSARQRLARSIADRGAVINSDTLPVVVGNGPLLETLFIHLLDNALKFVPPQRHPVIAIGVRLAHGQAVISITDNGIGVDPAFADRLFEPFARLTTRREFDGSGLGLAVCHRILQLHQGRIDMLEAPTQGAKVVLTLPFS